MRQRQSQKTGVNLRGPFLVLVLVLLSSIGISVVAGLQGIHRLEVMLGHVVEKDAQRLLHVTHIRRLFRTELLLSREQQALGLGAASDVLSRQLEQVRLERQLRLDQLRALGIPGAEAELAALAELHARGTQGELAWAQEWEALLARILESTEQRLTMLLRAAREETAAARRLLVGASGAALLAASSLGALVLLRVRQASRKLEHSEEQLRHIVASAPSLLVVLSSCHRPTFIPPRAPDLLGHPREVLARDFFAWVKPSEREALAGRFDQCLGSGAPIQGVNARGVREDGSEWDAWLSLAVVHAKPTPELLVQILDITAQRTAEAESRNLETQLRQAQKMETIGLLAGGIAHDFNNLLTAIKGYASLLREQVKRDASACESVDEIGAAADRAAALTRKLLSFSRKQLIEPKPHKVGDIVNGMQGLLGRILGEDVRLEVNAAADQHACMVDASQVEQVIMNLAVNARQAMPKGGLLIIETRNVALGDDYARTHPGVKPGPYVQLLVSDTGIGMTPEVARRVFEPFFTTKPAGQGTGLGLSVVYGAVRQLRGHVNLYSEPNVGTTFKIYWPASPGEVDSASTAPVPASRAAGNELLLLVEDDRLVRSFARRALLDEGYQVIDADSAETALETVRGLAAAPALLVTDVILPGRHGPELAEALRARYPRLPVLFCSGYSERLMSETGHLPPGATLLQKPYDAQTLVTRVRQMLSAPTATMEVGPRG